MASSTAHYAEGSSPSTSLVKYLEILPGDPIIEPSISPSIPTELLSIDLIENISVPYYRELYTKTGAMWLWTDRNFMSDETLHRIISDPELSVHVLRVAKDVSLPNDSHHKSSETSSSERVAKSTDNGSKEVEKEDAGYFELEWRTDASGVPQIEVSYFGLMPDFIGKRIGPWFLYELLKVARQRGGKDARIWVHTCNWDHPKAYQTYINGGFKFYKEATEPIEVPSGYKHISQP